MDVQKQEGPLELTLPQRAVCSDREDNLPASTVRIPKAGITPSSPRKNLPPLRRTLSA